MKGKLPTRVGRFILLLTCLICFKQQAQVNVFSEAFATSAGTTYTTANTNIGTNTIWSVTRSGVDFGARINSGLLTLTNDATGTSNVAGYILAKANTTNFAAPYNTILSSNPGVVTWTFNMRQSRANPNGFDSFNYGAAFILAGTTGTTNTTGTGYAVLLGGAGKIDPIRLVRYNTGIRSHTNIISSNTTGLGDFGSQYISVKVVYTPSTNTWQLYVRNDGTAAFQDPAVGNLVLQGSVINNTYTAVSLPVLGAYLNASTNNNNSASFDNINVTVATPQTTSISPPSKVAGTGGLTLTVNGSNFVNGSIVRWNGSSRTTTFVSATQLTAAITAADITTAGSFPVTVANGTAISNSQTFIVDPAGVPVFTTSTNALAAMTTVVGTASASGSYNVSGSNLTGADVVVTAPSNFEISLNNSTFAASLTIPHTTTLTNQPVTIYVRISAAAPVGNSTGNVSISTNGGSIKNVSVSGKVLAAQPSTATTGITFSNVNSTGMTATFTGGNGSSRIVLIRSVSAVTGVPVDGSSYFASASFGNGSELGTGNFVIYNGTGNSVTISDLSPATTYHIAVFEYNGTSAFENYTATAAIANRTTLNAVLGWQIYNSNAVNKIDFDNTVDGVNNGAFQGTGLSATGGSGELNSNTFAMTGFSTGNIQFGDASAEDTDYDKGFSSGEVTESGLYSFETSVGSGSLGIQTSVEDFAPGTVTIRFQNQTNAAITSINVGYKVFTYNDTPASSSFNFSHSANNSTYTAISAIDVTSGAAPDAVPAWKGNYRVATITGLNIAAGAYYYLRWTGSTVSGSGTYDEFALDDISLVANPTTNNVEFAGIAEDFVLQGNATMSNDLTVKSRIVFTGGKLAVNNRTLTIAGDVVNTVAGGLKGSASSRILITSINNLGLSFDTTTLGTTNVVSDLLLNSSSTNTIQLLTPLVLNGALFVEAGQTLNLLTNPLSGTLSTSITIDGNLFTQSASAALPSGKTWNGIGLVHYNATSSAQVVVPGTYTNLTLSSPLGSTAGGNITVTSILNLPTNNPSATAGSLAMGSSTLFMGPLAVNSGIGDVSGIITRNSITSNVVYTFGNQHTSIIFPATGTLPSSMSLKVILGVAPSWRPNAIKREYDFIQTGGVNTKAVIKAAYLDSELNGNVETKLVDWAHIFSTSNTIEQGRSNFSTTENWVELTNVNVGLYFQSTFDAVRLTLDESEAGTLTWNGSQSTSWTTAANWTPNATPSDQTTVFIPDAATTPNDPTINPVTTLGKLNIEIGGILNAPANSQFTMNGGAGAWINNGIYNAGTGTSIVTFTSLDATIAGATTFNNITVATGAGLRPLSNSYLKVSGSFINNGVLFTGAIDNTVEYIGTNQTLAVPNSTTVAAYHNLVITGSGAVFPASLNIRGNLTLNNTVNFAGKTIVATGLEPQKIGGSVSPTFSNLQINNATGVGLDTSISVSGTLTLTSGVLSVLESNLTLGTNAVAGTFSATSMIAADGTGMVYRNYSGVGSYFYPVGELVSNPSYSPISVNVTSGTFSNAVVGVAVKDGIHPDNHSTANYISRYWNVKQTGITNAVATITATYLPAEVLVAESTMAAAQLIGTFNQQTNPWIKFAALSANTLTATGATLPAGQTSAFTGIKGGGFTAAISGYGEFCAGTAVTLTATGTGGDSPYLYNWTSGLGQQQVVVPPTNVAGTFFYQVTMKDSNGITAVASAEVKINPGSVGGTISGNQSVCPGTASSDLTLSGYAGTIIQWEQSTSPEFVTPVIISSSSAVLSGTVIGSLTQTTYFRALVQNGLCSSAYSGIFVISVNSTTWNGTTWTNGVPTSTTAVVFSGNYTATGNISACSIVVENNAIVNIPTGFAVSISGAVNVNSGSFLLENNANLIQSSEVQNTGNISVRRFSSPLFRLDYTMWSSPVFGAQTLKEFSPQTTDNRFYTLTTSNNFFTETDPLTTTFTTAKGYLIRMRNNHIVYSPTAVAQPWLGTFSGVPNNGTKTFTISSEGGRYNMVGNPYPSPLNANLFLNANSTKIEGTLYFWRRRNAAPVEGELISAYYATYTTAGGVGVDQDNDDVEESQQPNGQIQVGQGFLVKALPAATGNIQFANTMRIADNGNGQFFRTSEDGEKHRIWLNVTSSGAGFGQTLIAYMDDAENGVDRADGKFFNDGNFALTSLIESEEYIIQGRAPFVASDVVPMNFKTPNAGDYTIELDNVDGLFTGDQTIFLHDIYSNIYHDLKASPYTFATEAGNFADRFTVVYQNAPVLSNPDFSANSVVVYKSDENIVINAGKENIRDVQVFDIRGRLLIERKNISAAEVLIPAEGPDQVLILKIKLENGAQLNKKIVSTK